MIDRPKACRVLVVEDEALVAMLVEEIFAEIGCEVVAVASYLDDAVEPARGEAVDFAIIDLTLHGESSLPVADILRERKIPFAFASGYGIKDLPARHQSALNLQKPFEQEDVEGTLRRIGLLPAIP